MLACIIEAQILMMSTNKFKLSEKKYTTLNHASHFQTEMKQSIVVDKHFKINKLMLFNKTIAYHTKVM